MIIMIVFENLHTTCLMKSPNQLITNALNFNLVCFNFYVHFVLNFMLAWMHTSPLYCEEFQYASFFEFPSACIMLFSYIICNLVREFLIKEALLVPECVKIIKASLNAYLI